jgi:hypothetical protein
MASADDIRLLERIRNLKVIWQVEMLPVGDLIELAHMVRRGDLRHVDEPSLEEAET